MSIEINDDLHPFSSVAYIVSSWGSRAFTGTGFLTGRNDVITASHVVYNASLGGLADTITVYPSYDPDEPRTERFVPTAVRYFNNVDPDRDGLIWAGDHTRGSLAGTEIDIALLSFSVDLGSRYGSFGIDWNFAGGPVTVAGYPGIYFRQPMADTGTVTRSAIDAYFVNAGDLELNSGNSGGPIYYTAGTSVFAVGVVSTTASLTEIGAHRFWLEQAMMENDALLVGGVTPVITFATTSLSQFEGNSGNIIFTYVVTRTASPISSSADWIVQSGGSSPATSADFADSRMPAGTLQFAPYETHKVINIAVRGDRTLEADETFILRLLDPQNASITTPTAVGVIRNDEVSPADAALVLAISNQLLTTYFGRGVDQAWRATIIEAFPVLTVPQWAAWMYGFAEADGAFAPGVSITQVVNQTFLNIFGCGALPFEQAAWAAAAEAGGISKQSLPWTIFTSYLGATNVPPAYQVPAQSRILAVDRFTTEVDTEAERRAFSGLGGTHAAEARVWLQSIRDVSDAALKIERASTDIGAIMSRSSTAQGTELLGFLSGYGASIEF